MVEEIKEEEFEIKKIEEKVEPPIEQIKEEKVETVIDEIKEEIKKLEASNNELYDVLKSNNEGTHIPYYYSYGPNGLKETSNTNGGSTKKVLRNVSNSQRRKFR